VKENGLLPQHISIPKESIKMVIDGYTREAGVRDLERNLGALCRSVAVKYSKFSMKNNTTKKNFIKIEITTDVVR
jgi:ATP-dependent Lon protease